MIAWPPFPSLMKLKHNLKTYSEFYKKVITNKDYNRGKRTALYLMKTCAFFIDWTRDTTGTRTRSHKTNRGETTQRPNKKAEANNKFIFNCLDDFNVYALAIKEKMPHDGFNRDYSFFTEKKVYWIMMTIITTMKIAYPSPIVVKTLSWDFHT